MASYRIEKNAQYNSNEIYFDSKPAARFYRRECDGVGIYDFRLGVIRETIGNFRPI